MSLGCLTQRVKVCAQWNTWTPQAAGPFKQFNPSRPFRSDRTSKDHACRNLLPDLSENETRRTETEGQMIKGKRVASFIPLVVGVVSFPGCSSDSHFEGFGHEGDSRGGVQTLSMKLDANFVPAPGGARRILSHQYERTIEQLLGPEAAAAAVPPPDASLGGVDTVAAFELAVPPLAVDEYEDSAIKIASAAVAAPQRLAEHAPCVTGGPVDATFRAFCYNEVAHRIGFLAWRLPPTQEDKERLVEIAQIGERSGTSDAERFELGLTFLIATVLESPSFIYSVEVGSPAGPNSRQLNSFEVATRMSLFLLGRAPSEELLLLAASGGLSSSTDVRAVALELLETEAAREGFDDHLGDLFQLKLLKSKGKDATAFPQFDPELAEAMNTEVTRFVNDIVFDNPTSFLDVLRSESRFVNQRLVADVYRGLPNISTDWQLVDFSSAPLALEERAGILTMPAILSIFSHGVLNSPTRRGLFIREQLLCGSVPPPPPSVDVNIQPPPPDLTLRNYLEDVHAAAPACVNCHTMMDPLGFAFEHFDAIGQWRATDNGLPVDSSVQSFDFPTTLSGPRELAEALAADERVPMCWIQQLHTAAVGTVAGPSHPARSALDDLLISFASSNYDMKALLADLVSSPAFLQVASLD